MRGGLWLACACEWSTHPFDRERMEKTMYIDDIKAQARSESMNKWIGVFEEEFSIKAEGRRPTERMEDVIRQLHARYELLMVKIVTV